MDKRKERMFEPEKQIDFIKLISELDWTTEINPVMLVKTANRVAGLKGQRKYETNEVSFGALVKSFEMRVSRFVDTRFQGKDRFYSLKKGCTVEQMLVFARTGEYIEPKAVMEDKKQYIPTYPAGEIMEEAKTIVRTKRDFPDDEALMKTAVVLGFLKKGSGTAVNSEMRDFMAEVGWKRQRSIGGNVYTAYQEASKILSEYIDLPKDVIKTKRQETTFMGEVGKIKEYIDMVISLISDEEDLAKILDLMKQFEDAPVAEEIKEETVEPKKTEAPEEKEQEQVAVQVPKDEVEKPTKRNTSEIVYSSPERGARKVVSSSAPMFEGNKVKWTKSLIGMALIGCERGTYVEYHSLASYIKKNRFVEIPMTELRQSLSGISNQFPGIFRSMDGIGFTIGSTALVQSVVETYDQAQIEEQIYMRLKMPLTSLEKNYPDLKIEIASEISESDNIYRITANRTEHAERAMVKLVYCMRDGEVILESPNNWTIRRIKSLIDKLGLSDVY